MACRNQLALPLLTASLRPGLQRVLRVGLAIAGGAIEPCCVCAIQPDFAIVIEMRSCSLLIDVASRRGHDHKLLGSLRAGKCAEQQLPDNIDPLV